MSDILDAVRIIEPSLSFEPLSQTTAQIFQPSPSDSSMTVRETLE